MAVGVVFTGRRLSGSCGGVGANGEELGDCSCARKENDICASDDDTGLIGMAELGYPKRALKDHTGHSRLADNSVPEFEV